MSKPVSVRYIVYDVDTAIRFYTAMLDFKVEMHPATEFAILSRGNLRLLLSKPSGRGGGSQRMPDGTRQTPGGWNRFEIQVEDLESEIKRLKGAGCTFRNEIVTGVGGKQILLEDPSGNLIELFQYFKDFKPQ
jgi:catechol 2,3-dioxygenase-like lactoylglutathione lyase family enzyme